MTSTRLASAAAFQELLDLLRDADQTFVTGSRAVGEELSVVEGYRHLTQLLSYAFDLYLEADAERPRFTPLASPTRKILGDNVDSRYFFAPLRGDRTYRIRGRRGSEVYLAFCVYGGKPDGEWSERVVANVSQRDIDFGPQGEFELTLSTEPAPLGTRNRIHLDPDAVCVISREYYTEPFETRFAELQIEATPAPSPPPPLGDAALARRLRAVATFVRETINVTPIPLPPPNILMPPMPWNPNIPGWGTPDNVYSLGAFQLEPGQAIVIEGRSPRCNYWGVQLWNRFMQSLDYRYHRVSINHAQAVMEPDGSFRIVIADRDPGMPNWLDTAGHREGIFFCRWLQADELPDPPSTRVVDVSQLRRR